MTDDLTVAALVALMIYRELEDDYVELWKLPRHIRDLAPAASDDRVQVIAEAVLEALLSNDVALGRLDMTTGAFEPWDPRGAVPSVMAAWRGLGRDPNMGEVAWLALTK